MAEMQMDDLDLCFLALCKSTCLDHGNVCSALHNSEGVSELGLLEDGWGSGWAEVASYSPSAYRQTLVQAIPQTLSNGAPTSCANPQNSPALVSNDV